MANTFFKAFREFYNNTNMVVYSRPLTKFEWYELWALTNGLLPLGACIGALCSGLLADSFGRYFCFFIDLFEFFFEYFIE
jgi:hypothetical protein